MRKVLQIIWNVIFWMGVVVILAGSVFFAFDRNPDKSIFGFRAYNVLSGSMAPTLSIGDLAVVKTASPETVQKGDIVTYYPTGGSGATVTHRVVETRMENGQVILKTRGDAVEQADPEFYGEDLIGRVVFHIPLAGGMIAWMQANAVLTVVIAGLAVLLIWLLSVLSKKAPQVNESINIRKAGKKESTR